MAGPAVTVVYKFHKEKDIWSLESCVFCGQYLDETSKLLRCLHTVCCSCVVEKRKDSRLQCRCLKVTIGKLIDYPFLPPDAKSKFEICSELNCNDDGSKMCILCKILFCEPCMKVHLSKNNDHGPHLIRDYPITEELVTCIYCGYKSIEIFCMECSLSMCSPCHLTNHHNHEYRMVKDVAKEIFLGLGDKYEFQKHNYDIDNYLQYVEDVLQRLKIKKEPNMKIGHTEKNRIKIEINRRAIVAKSTIANIGIEVENRSSLIKSRIKIRNAINHLYIDKFCSTGLTSYMENRPMFLMCVCCSQWALTLILCTNCKRTYHNSCHVPPLPEKTNPYDLNWRCTMCCDINRTSQELSEKIIARGNNLTLDHNERKIAERILLELFCQYSESRHFQNIPPQIDRLMDYGLIPKIISLNNIKMLLKIGNDTYKSLINPITDMKIVFKNAMVYHSPGDERYEAAYELDTFLTEMLLLWVPQLNLSQLVEGYLNPN